METKKSNLKSFIKKWIPVVLVIVGVALFFGRRASTSVEVRRVDVKDRIVKKSVSASGSVKSKDEVSLSFPLVGVVKKISVKEGDSVKKGDLLSYLDTTAQYQSVQYYKDARDIEIRQKDLFEQERDTNEDLLGGSTAYEIKLREYNESISQAEANYQSALSTLSKYYIYAPFEGTIVEVPVNENETVSIGQMVLKIADLTKMVFEIDVDQEDFGLLKEGQEVEIEVDAYPDFTFGGVIKELPLFASQETNNFVVKIDFTTFDGYNLKLGLLGDAYMIMQKTETPVRSVTFNEISYDQDDKPYIWILVGKRVRKLPIDIGLEGDVYTEIKTDLTGKTVVIPAKEGLEIEDGFRAKLIN